MHWRSFLDALRATLRSALGPQPGPRPLPVPAGSGRIPAQRNRRASIS